MELECGKCGCKIIYVYCETINKALIDKHGEAAIIAEEGDMIYSDYSRAECSRCGRSLQLAFFKIAPNTKALKLPYKTKTVW